MIKTEHMTRYCKVVGKDVVLDSNRIEDQSRGIKGRARIENCDSEDICGAKTNSDFNHSECHLNKTK